MSLASKDIKLRARKLGFTSVGIVPAGRLDAEGARLDEWLARGYHGTMAWLEREPEKRADPRLLMPGCRSVIVATLNYHTSHKHVDEPGHGKISRYAWGDDYHDVLREKLKALVGWIHETAPRIQTKICVDTAPFMDKAWAARAGLGWIGKHTNLITKDVGSWVFIGSLLIDRELEYDRPETEDHCGTCTACIDACPTDAITAAYVVDSNRCISYATIECREETLPEDIAAELSGWLYGCDICQDVCPWNRFQQESGEVRFAPRAGETSLELKYIEDLEHAGYAARFRGSAMKRAKLTGLKRNANSLRHSVQRTGYNTPSEEE